ncbi:MAG: sigma 54-interacting transcriptional regulator [Planctomycetota bacterium]
MPRLVISQGIGKGTVYEINSDVTLGRASSNRIQLLGKQISRNHALILKKDNHFVVKDLKSKNGVFVNGEKIAAPPILNKNDQIAIGSVLLIYEPDFEIIGHPDSNLSGKTDNSTASGGLIILQEEESTPTSLISTPVTEDTSLVEETNLMEPGGLKPSKISQISNLQELAIVARRLKSLYQISSVISSTLDEETMLKQSMPVILEVFKCGRGAIIFSDPAGANPYPACNLNQKNEPFDITISQTVLNRVLKNRQAVISANTEIDPRFQLSRSIRLDQVKSVLCVPLITKNKLLGAIYLDTQEITRSFEQGDIRLLVTIGQQLATAVENARLYRQVDEEVKILRHKIKSEVNLVGEHRLMIEILDKIRKVSATDTTILLMGETGTGKELIAHAIHYESPRRHKSFVAVDCSAIPSGLLESELFGHEKGAFTGADRTKPGKFELANGGTLFLDEISTMPMDTQIKLLRVLEERKLTHVGGIKVINIEVRIIAASNRNLEEAIAQGNFREDLFYRLAVVPFIIPPLRERKSDISLLISYFIEKFNRETGKHVGAISPEALKMMAGYPWPGNVRELRNAIERAVVLCEKNIITPEDLPPAISQKIGKAGLAILSTNLPSADLATITKQVEKQYIIKALEESNGKKIKAAEILKISRPTLDKKLKEYNLD